MKFINIALVTTAIAAIVGCATVNSPEGGPKDTTPPTLVASNPQGQQLNVSTQTIRLEFDEEVQPNNMLRELLITPNIQSRYRVNTNRNVMELVFDEPLEDSTTYTFNFRKGIQDITEKNIAEGLTLTFSTGSYIDSSTVSGTVVDLLTQLPEKEAIVALYPTNDSINVRKNRPYYQAQVTETGNFRFENVREGEYRIFAIVDKNNNSIYDTEAEKIAYLNNPIQITPDTQQVRLQTVLIDTKRPILTRRENYLDRFVANYNEGIATFHARPETGQPDTIIHKKSLDGRAIELFGGAGFTGGRAILTAIDSAGNTGIDTIRVAFEGKRAQRVRGAQIKTPPNGDGYAIGQLITVELETPVNITSKTPVSLMADSIVVQAFSYPENIKLDRTTTELSFTLPAINGGRNRQYSIAFDSTAIVPAQGTTLSLPRLPITIAEARGSGTVRGSVNSKYTSYTIQLLDSEYKVKRELQNHKTFAIRNIEPGTYRIRVLIDENKNGVWQAGDPELQREPEKVYLYPDPIEVRANWELENIRLQF